MAGNITKGDLGQRGGPQHVLEPFRVYLPPGLGEAALLPVLPEIFRSLHAQGGQAQEHPEVVVHPEEIQLVADTNGGFLLEEKGEPDGKRAGAKRLDQAHVVDRMGDFHRPLVHRGAVRGRLKSDHVVRHADGRPLPPFRVDHVVERGVGAEDVRERREASLDVPSPGRHDPAEVPADDEDVRLVEGDEDPRVPAEGPHRALREPEKLPDRGRILPGGLLRKPRGVGEMVQRDHGLDPGLPKGGRDPDVPVHRLPVPFPATGRHPAPLHRKPVGVDAEIRQEGQVLVRAREVPHAMEPRPPVVLVPHVPVGPVAPRRAFHLERGGRHAPQELSHPGREPCSPLQYQFRVPPNPGRCGDRLRGTILTQRVPPAC